MSAAGGAGAPAAAVPQPAPILQLPEAVVHRIAAGEVIQRPASALKEMVENSMDAGATRISVTVKEGGLRLLQVSDDGCGITRGDLPLLCVRHATSKLRAYEDLETIATLGFRGEALASISFVAHLSVTTMTRGGQHGWRATYQDGVLLDPPGAKPCAAVPGTVLTVEDLFYNVPARRKAFRAGGAEEGALVLDLLQVSSGGCEQEEEWGATCLGGNGVDEGALSGPWRSVARESVAQLATGFKLHVKHGVVSHEFDVFPLLWVWPTLSLELVMMAHAPGIHQVSTTAAASPRRHHPCISSATPSGQPPVSASPCVARVSPALTCPPARGHRAWTSYGSCTAQTWQAPCCPSAWPRATTQGLS